METFRHEVTIDAPLKRVFTIMGDMHRQARMLAELPVVHDVRVSPSSSATGQIEIDVAGRTLQAEYHLSRSPPHRIRYKTDGDWSERGDARLESLPDGGTRLSYVAKYELGGVIEKLLSVLSIDERMARRHLQRVKAEAERRFE